MARRRGQRKGWLRAENGSWLLTYRLYDAVGRSRRETVTIGPSDGPGKLTQKQAERFAWDHYLGKVDQISRQPKSTITVEQFWNNKYWPGTKLALRKSTRGQYESLWNRWIKPKLGSVPIVMVDVDGIEQLLSDAQSSGKSSATVKHLRKVISAVLSRARATGFFIGDNPAGLVRLQKPISIRKPYSLTIDQARIILAGLQPDPATRKRGTPVNFLEAMRAALLTGMNVSELFGLRTWHVNMSAETVERNGEKIPPMSIAVREQWYRGEAGRLKTERRRRDIPICSELASLLRGIIARTKFGQVPDRPVFANRKGQPLNDLNIRKRHIAPIGEKLGLPHLGWHIFRHTFSTWMEQVGMTWTDRCYLMGHSGEGMTAHYTHEDRNRMLAGLELLGERIADKKIEKVVEIRQS